MNADDVQKLLGDLGTSLEGPARYIFELATRNAIISAVIPLVGLLIFGLLTIALVHKHDKLYALRITTLGDKVHAKWEKQFLAYQVDVEARFADAVQNVNNGSKYWNDRGRPELRVDTYERVDEATDTETTYGVAALLTGITSVACLVWFLFRIPDLLNPEWSAIQQLIGQLASIVP